MDGWDKFNETSILDKEDFCSHLNILLMQITRRQKDFVKILKKKFWVNTLVFMFVVI